MNIDVKIYIAYVWIGIFGYKQIALNTYSNMNIEGII
jgi:hypothetical protein